MTTKSIFINLHVKDLDKSREFYTKLGFSINEQFSDDTAASVVISDTIHVMLLTYEKFKQFTSKDKLAEHEHPTMLNSKINAGNGLILYFRTENMEQIRENLKLINYSIEKEIQLNPNSRKREFSVIDPDGYYLTITEFHKYKG